MEKNDLIVTEFDIITTKGSTQIIKALIPFLSPREQKMIAIVIRIWELIQTIRFFEQHEFIKCGQPKELSFNPELIRHIKKYCTPESQQMIDMILKFMNMSELMNIMKLFENENGESGIFSGDNEDNSGNNTENNSESSSQQNFNNTDFGNIMNIFQTMNQAGMDLSGVQKPSSVPPANIIQSMMSGRQENLYQEFMEKLDNDFTD